MLAHIDELRRTLHGLECGLCDIVGRAHHGDHGTVGVSAWIDIQKLHTGNRLDGTGDLLDDPFVAPFREIGHALYDPLHDILSRISH